MFEYEISPDIADVERFLRGVDDGIAQRAVPRALNRTATAVRTEAVRSIRKERALKAGVIRQATSIQRATRRNHEATVTVTGKPIPIRHFVRNLQAKSGLTVRIKQGGKRTILRENGRKAFSNPKLAGGNVFVRTSSKRLPVKKWPPVPGFPRVFVQRHIVDALGRVVDRVLPQRLRHEIQFEIDRIARLLS